jgi:5'-3' exonuclease
MGTERLGNLLVVDCHYICHRAYHTTGKLSHRGQATGVAFGFFRTVQWLTEEFQASQIAFCFEGNSLLRRKLYPEYKKRNHKDLTDEEKEARFDLRRQIECLQHEHLLNLGFRNIFSFDGFESDDLMASIAENAKQFETIYLVTGDYDMFQCLRPGVKVYSPHNLRLYTHKWFQKEFGLAPWQWANVKALAGCSSDNVKGLWRCGEKTAVRILRKELPKTHSAWLNVNSPEGQEIYRRNMRLVRLPFKGCPVINQFKSNEISAKRWTRLCDNLGMVSLSRRQLKLTRPLELYEL